MYMYYDTYIMDAGWPFWRVLEEDMFWEKTEKRAFAFFGISPGGAPVMG